MFCRRKMIRLPDYDYRQNGLYFVTICSKNRKHLFGHIMNDTVKLTYIGQHLYLIIKRLESNYPDITISKFLVMPDHIHAIIAFIGNENTVPISLGQFINTFKGRSSRICKQALWQRGYYEHIIRNENELSRIMKYIENNPRAWAKKYDCE